MSLTYEVIRCVPGHEVLLQALDPGPAAGFPRRAERAAAGLAQAPSGRPRGPGTMTSPDTPVPSGGAGTAAGRRAVTGFGPAVDAALEACVVLGFSRIGLAVRSRLLPEYTADGHPGLDRRTILNTGATSGIGTRQPSRWTSTPMPCR